LITIRHPSLFLFHCNTTRLEFCLKMKKWSCIVGSNKLGSEWGPTRNHHSMGDLNNHLSHVACPPSKDMMIMMKLSFFFLFPFCICLKKKTNRNSTLLVYQMKKHKFQ
jgi:hypothetical protein